MRGMGPGNWDGFIDRAGNWDRSDNRNTWVNSRKSLNPSYLTSNKRGLAAKTCYLLGLVLVPWFNGTPNGT
jgi:hypothetical protein